MTTHAARYVAYSSSLNCQREALDLLKADEVIESRLFCCSA